MGMVSRAVCWVSYADGGRVIVNYANYGLQFFTSNGTFYVEMNIGVSNDSVGEISLTECSRALQAPSPAQSGSHSIHRQPQTRTLSLPNSTSSSTGSHTQTQVPPTSGPSGT